MASAYKTLSDEARAEKMSLLHEQMQSGYKELIVSDGWKKYLNTMAKFYRYSANNCMLIMSQNPEATQIAAYGKWQQLGRQVNKGEKGIQILAPVIKKEDGDSKVVGFRRAHVFDITQTSGDPLPSPVTLLKGEAPDIMPAIEAVISQAGFNIQTAPLANSVNGETRWASSMVVIAAGLEPAQRMKTMVHELAHVMLHQHEPDRARAEIEAESVAYVVCQHFGLETSEYSLGYVASWAGDDPSRVKATAENVVRTANKIVYGIEQQLATVDEPTEK